MENNKVKIDESETKQTNDQNLSPDKTRRDTFDIFIEEIRRSLHRALYGNNTQQSNEPPKPEVATMSREDRTDKKWKEILEIKAGGSDVKPETPPVTTPKLKIIETDEDERKATAKLAAQTTVAPVRLPQAKAMKPPPITIDETPSPYMGGLYSNRDTFTTNVVILEKSVVTINDYLEDVCKEIQRLYPGLEFSILAKVRWTDDGVVVTDDYVIPVQKVSPARVEYEPLLPYKTQGYDAVIHSHHNMGGSFSSTDHDFINSFFPVSILFANGKFVAAQMLCEIPKGYFRMNATIITKRTRPTINLEGIDKKIRRFSFMESFRNVSTLMKSP